MTDEIISSSGADSQTNSTSLNESNKTIAQTPETKVSESQKVSDTTSKEQVKHERTYTRDELAKITNAETKKAKEQGRLEALDELKRVQSQGVQQPDVAQAVQSGLSDQELAARIDRIADQKNLKAQLMQEANSFKGKLELENDPDMKLAYGKLRLDDMPMGYVHVLNSVDNTKDVIKEFAKFPEKLTSILNTTNIFGVEAGKEAIIRVSESIKKNQEASNVKLPDAPISQIGPSNTGTDNGQLTASDYRNRYKNRY